MVLTKIKSLVAYEAGVICVKGVSPSLLFAIDRAKLAMRMLAPTRCARAPFPPAL